MLTQEQLALVLHKAQMTWQGVHCGTTYRSWSAAYLMEKDMLLYMAGAVQEALLHEKKEEEQHGEHLPTRER